MYVGLNGLVATRKSHILHGVKADWSEKKAIKLEITGSDVEAE